MYKTPPSLNSLCFSHVGCSWRFGALRKTSSRQSFCELFSKKHLMQPAHVKTVQSLICWNKCHHWYIAPQYRHRDGTRFVLKSFFVYKYLWGVSRQLSQRRGSKAANSSRQWKLTCGFRSEWIVSVSEQVRTSPQCSQRSQSVTAVALELFLFQSMWHYRRRCG